MALKRLVSARNDFEAHHLRAVLEAAGLRALVIGEQLGQARGSLPMTLETAPCVWVDASDFERAEAVLAEAKNHRRDAADAWTCPSCGECVESTFDQCWKCMHARPAE
jgi:cytochrome c556